MENNFFDPMTMPRAFVKVYGGNESDVHIFAAPSRINIIGEHIDYNGGKVFPTAIDRYLYVGIRKRQDTAIVYQDVKFPGIFKFDVNDDFVYKKENDYANYLNGILSIMKSKGKKFDVGFDVLIASNVPPGGSISSSSALECSFAFAVSELFGFNISRKEIALIGQMSEHKFMNMNCGIMDQFIIATAKKNTAELLDCAKIECEYVPLLLDDKSFVVMNTKKKRQLANSKYNERRSQCEEGLKILQNAAIDIENKNFPNTRDLPNLCSLTSEQFENCKSAIKDKVILSRVRHCVTENERVTRAVEALKKSDFAKLGLLMRQSHESLKNDYEVTGLELDTIVEAANKQPNCLGARMTGAGFAGCAIALVQNDAIKAFTSSVQDEYTKIVGYNAEFYVCKTGEGVHEI